MKRQSHPIKRVLLVARDYAFPPINQHLEAITNVAEENEVDTISFALSTLDGIRAIPKLASILKSSKHLHYAMVETFRPAKNDSEFNQRFHLISRHWHKEYRRHFASSFEPEINLKKDRLMNELPRRCFADRGLVLICGEISLLKCNGKNRRLIEDPLHFRDRLKPGQTIFAPAHTFMRRPEQKTKRIALSTHGRTVISVWNKNGYMVAGCDADIPIVAAT